MIDNLVSFFSDEGFMPHGHCYLWTPGVLWTEILANTLIALAYFTIPYWLYKFRKNRPDLPFAKAMAHLFAVFIFSCGISHIIDIIVIYKPWYWLEAVIDTITAASSIVTAIVFTFRLPKMIKMNSITDLEKTIDEQQVVITRAGRLLRAVVNNTPGLVYAKDLEGRNILANPPTLELIGLPAEQVVGKTDYDFLPDKEAALELMARDHEIMVSGKPKIYEELVNDRWFLSVKAPLLDENNQTVGLVGISQEITDRVKVEQKLKETNRLFNSILSASTNLIYAKDRQKRFTLVNSALVKLNNLPIEQILHKTAAEFYKDVTDPDQNERIARIDEKVMTEKIPISTREFAKGRHFILMKAPLLDGDECVGLVGISTDITEVVKLNETLEQQVEERTMELKHSNEELEKFSYSVAHDLRAPLRAIDGYSVALIEDHEKDLPEDAKVLLNRVRKAASKMGELIDSMLQLSRITKGVLVKETFSLSDMAKSITDQLQVDQPRANLTLLIEPDMIAHADPRYCKILLQNLFDNAWKYTSKKENPEIIFTKANMGNGEKVWLVRDNGAGFNMDYKDKLFQVFQRLHTEDEFIGTGVGLATVQRIINKHGGKIWAVGKVNEGATFFFMLGK